MLVLLLLSLLLFLFYSYNCNIRKSNGNGVSFTHVSTFCIWYKRFQPLFIISIFFMASLNTLDCMVCNHFSLSEYLVITRFFPPLSATNSSTNQIFNSSFCQYIREPTQNELSVLSYAVSTPIIHFIVFSDIFFFTSLFAQFTRKTSILFIVNGSIKSRQCHGITQFSHSIVVH